VTSGDEKQEEQTPPLQSPLIHEGADPDPGYDSNEGADEKVRIEQPSGEEIGHAKSGSERQRDEGE
jgi:hypothetical protein